MTVQAIEADITYTFNDEGQYPFAFDILSPRDVTVQFIDNLGVRHVLAMGTDYLVINNAGARYIEIISTCGYIGQQGQLFIYRDMPVEQPTDWVNNEELDMELLEKSFDRIIMILQQFNTQMTSELAAITWRDSWKTNTVYKVRDLVQAPNTNIYLATVSHTAGVFEDDLLAGKWNLIIDISVIAEYVSAMASKADITYVDAELADKADITYVDAELADKADITYVDAELADKADITYVDAGLASAQAEVALLPTVSDLNIAGNIINGDFQVAQEGTTHNTIGYGSIDGVYLDFIGSGLSVSQESFVPGQTDVPGEPVNYARFTVNSVAGEDNIAQYQHRIPDVRNYAGGKCFVAFDAKADVAGKTIAVRLEQNFGTGGSATVFTPVQIKTLSNTWTGDWHVFEFDVPSIAGKIIGTDENDHIAVLIVFDAGSSYSDYADVGQKSGVYDICKLRVVRNLWELNHYRQDYYDALMDCYPYFQLYDFGSSTEKMGQYFTWAGTAGTSWPGIEMVLHVPMIKKPVATYTGYFVENCTLTSILTGKQFCTIRVRAEAIGSYIISGGTLTLDARV